MHLNPSDQDVDFDTSAIQNLRFAFVCNPAFFHVGYVRYDEISVNSMNKPVSLISQCITFDRLADSEAERHLIEILVFACA